jgi:predicted helicase
LGAGPNKEDPVVHFYETFLAAYDPALREKRGVYYTPEPVVSYIVRSVDHILENDFSLPDRLASRETIEINGEKIPQVLILDPAAGTGTFLHGVVDQIHNIMTVEKDMAGAWDSYVSDHLLPRLFGFELLMAPYAVCHLKLAIQLYELGYTFNSGERLRVYLTNTLQEAFDTGELAMFARAIAKEANEAGKIKSQAPVMVVLGNPPYSGHSANKSEWIADLLRGKENKQTKATENYFMVDGKPLGEKNPKWLNDDYVKFIRFAQWRIEQTGYGILAFISNHGYLDNPTFRGMRQSLMNTFDDIYLLDLHGNAKKKEKAPDGGKDENVFDIQQGVAIGIFVKKNNTAENQPAKVFHADLWGVREVVEHDDNGDEMLTGGKYRALYDSDVDSTEWQTLSPQSPYYFFMPYDTSYLAEYEKGWKVDQIFPVNSIGITSARDKLTIHWTADGIWQTVKNFSSLPREEARENYQLGKDAKDWKVSSAQKDLLKEGLSQDNIVPLLYRPFDIRWTYYTGRSSGFICRPRPKVMRNMLGGPNLGLCTNKQVNNDWLHVLCANSLINDTTVSLLTRERTYLFPMYLYPIAQPKSKSLMDMIEASSGNPNDAERSVNLAQEFNDDFSTRLKLTWLGDGRGDLKKTFGPEDVFHYIYAVMHSPTYRERYAEYLRMDFPRIPLTSNIKLMRALCAHGAELTTLHLMEGSPETFATFPKKGDNKVEKIRFDQAEERVFINEVQYFGNVPQEVWDFHIGGYQVCHKWLKDRKGRVLSFDELAHYQQILAIIDRTMTLMAEIDDVIDQEGGWPIQ